MCLCVTSTCITAMGLYSKAARFCPSRRADFSTWRCGAERAPFALPGVVRQKRWRATRTPSSVGSTRPWRACPAVHWAAQPAASTGSHSSRPRPAAGIRSDSMPSPFAGLKVPQGNDRRELYKSQYRAIYTCTCSLAPDCQRPPTQPSPRGSTEVDRGGWDVFRVSLSQDVRS